MFHWVLGDRVGDRVESVSATSLALPYAASLLVHNVCAGSPYDDVWLPCLPCRTPVGYESGSVCVDSMAYGRAAVPWEYQAACANDVLGEHHKW